MDCLKDGKLEIEVLDYIQDHNGKAELDKLNNFLVYRYGSDFENIFKTMQDEYYEPSITRELEFGETIVQFHELGYVRSALMTALNWKIIKSALGINYVCFPSSEITNGIIFINKINDIGWLFNSNEIDEEHVIPVDYVKFYLRRGESQDQYPVYISIEYGVKGHVFEVLLDKKNSCYITITDINHSEYHSFGSIRYNKM